MKIRDKQIILETVREVSDVFWAPTYNDNVPGGRNCAFLAAYNVLQLPEHVAEECALGFANPTLSDYWDLLLNADKNYRSTFDFSTGEVQQDFKPRKSNDPHLIAAQHIRNFGLDKFTIHEVEGENYRAIRFLNKSNGKYFDFKDIDDASMFFSCHQLCEHYSEVTTEQTLTALVNDFIS